jgi:hypothetical protein
VNKGKRRGRSVMPRPPLRFPTTPVLYFLTVKNHAISREPVLVVFWSRGLPARSVASVVTTAL